MNININENRNLAFNFVSIMIVKRVLWHVTKLSRAKTWTTVDNDIKKSPEHQALYTQKINMNLDP